MAPFTILRQNRDSLLLVLVLALAAFLYLFDLGKEGFSNHYYAAAVRSMLENPALLVFNSFDPAGFVTVDKPPVALWVQTASAAVLGYSGWSLILPQAIAALGSVILVYYVVSRPFGKPAGIIAALALTVTPILVAVARTNNMDGLLVFVLLLSVMTAVRAWKEGSVWYLLASAVLIGIGFNIKMIEAFVVVPACFGIYLLAPGLPFRTRCRHVTAAFAVLLVVSFSWAAFMEMTPVEDRPYIGSTQDNSVMELIFGYNGLHRLLGGFGTHGHAIPGINQSRGDLPPGIPGPDRPGGWERNSTARERMPGNPGTDGPPGRMEVSSGPMPPGGYRSVFPGSAPNMDPSRMSGRGPGGMNDGGEPGLFRMGDAGMSGQISWLLPFGLIGLLAWLRKPAWTVFKGLGEREVVTLAMVLWIVPELLYFSFTEGFYHTYYVVMVAPPLAALVGIGAVTMYQSLGSPGVRGWLLPVAVLATGVSQWIFMMYEARFSGPLPLFVLIGTVICTIVLTVIRLIPMRVSPELPRAAAVLGVALLFIAPAVWSCTPVFYTGSATLPVAGPSLATRDGGSGPGAKEQADTSALYTYLTTHRTGEKYLIGMSAANSGTADFIIATGAPAIAIGGFTGSDPILTVDSFRELVSGGDIRYFMTGGGGGPQGAGGSSLSSWVAGACREVPADEWSTSAPGRGSGGALYDCKGAA
jgi:4-amino-4-deoxy-L-arabinose transferase-like glycosyltransferase